MQIDSRLVGTTTENIFLSLMNLEGIFAHSFNTAAFDGVVFDIHNKYFKVGKSLFFVQIKCRGSKGDTCNPQGHSQQTLDKILAISEELQIPNTSLYIIVGFFKNNDIRQMKYYNSAFFFVINI
ncbi:MAG: hypothetical protein ACXV5H_07135 [Halobacteriota archaeon]